MDPNYEEEQEASQKQLGLLILHDAISHNQPQIPSDCTIHKNLIIHEKLHNF